MKKPRKTPAAPRDTPATRKRRLQQRLKEMSARSEREMAALMKAVEKVKAAFRTEKKS